MIRDWLSPFLGFNFISVAIPDNRQPVWALPPRRLGVTAASYRAYTRVRSVQVSSGQFKHYAPLVVWLSDTTPFFLAQAR